MKINPVEIYKNHNVHYIGHGQLESSPENFSTLHVIWGCVISRINIQQNAKKSKSYPLYLG